MIRLFGRPVPETRPEPVRHGRDPQLLEHFPHPRVREWLSAQARKHCKSTLAAPRRMIDRIAFHYEPYSGSCSNTSRTARYRTSGEYLGHLAMTPGSQGMEPPANLGRFTSGSIGILVGH